MTALPPGLGFKVYCSSIMGCNFSTIGGMIIYYLFDPTFDFMDMDLPITLIFFVLGAVVGGMIAIKYLKTCESLKEENYTLHVVMVFLLVPFGLLLNVPWILACKLSGTI